MIGCGRYIICGYLSKQGVTFKGDIIYVYIYVTDYAYKRRMDAGKSTKMIGVLKPLQKGSKQAESGHLLK